MSLSAALQCYREGDLHRADLLCAALDTPDAWHLRGLIAHRRGALSTATSWLQRALAVRAEPLWLANLGAVFLSAEAHAEAAVALRQALALNANQRDAHSNLSAALLHLDQPQAALESAAAALSLDPAFAVGYNNLGAALQELGRLEDARAAFLAATQHAPDDRDARMNQGILTLLADGLAQDSGWQDYEARLDPAELAARPPLWQGEPLDPRQDRLLLYAEQGLGDTLQFCRYAPLLARAGASITLEVPAALRPLLSSGPVAAGVTICTPAETAALSAGQPPRFSLPLLSLPRVLGASRALRTAWRGPYLQASAARVAHWRRWLAAERGRAVVAVVWQGNPAAEADRGRSLPLSALRPLGVVPGVRLVSVQKGPGESQLAAAVAEGWIEALPGLDAEGGSFLDTAAVMAVADLVVTVDTATAHLAGALGRPVWVLLRRVPDWRWGVQGEETPWYPSARLLRQTSPGEWGPVVAAAAARLEAWISRRARLRVRPRR